MASPAVSIIIPAYNYARCLADAVHSALAQREDGIDVEVIVVDDGSTDATPEVVASFGDAIRGIRRENGGLSAARNTGMEAARGEFLIFLDADDLIAPHLAARHLETFRADPELGASVCQCVQSSLDGTDVTATPWPLFRCDLDAHLCGANIAPVHAIMIRASAARAAGPFDTELRACEDYDFWLRCAAGGCRFGPTPGGPAVYRRHGESMSARRERQVLHDAAVRLRAGALLDAHPEFPAARRLGLLAHATGAFACATEMLRHGHPDMAARLMREFSRMARKAAAAPPPAPDAAGFRDVALQYYGACILSAEDRLPLFPDPGMEDLTRSFAAVRKLFPHLKADDEWLRRKVLLWHKSLYVPPDAIRDACARMGLELKAAPLS